ncbi:MAG: DNA repair protein RecN [Deinococcota bacterium]
MGVLQVLELQDLAIVDALSLELGAGLNVLTGETGAGKSILVDALTLLTGGRADSSLVRQGARRALVQGTFDQASVADNVIEVMSRRIQAGKSSTARVNGEVITARELAAIGRALVAIHGQHASQTLLDTSAQRQLLDRTLDTSAQELLTTYQQEFARYQQLAKTLESLQESVRERARRLDVLRYQLDEIDAANLSEGEEASLTERVQSLRYAERIVQQVGQATALLVDADVNATELNATELVGQARDSVTSVAKYHGDLATLAQELDDGLAALQATADSLSEFLSGFETEPGELEQLEARLTLIESLKLKYGDSVDAILAYREDALEELKQLERADSDLDNLQADYTQLETSLVAHAQQLCSFRAEAAQALSSHVTEQLQPLGMPNARFEVTVQPSVRLSQHGQDELRFAFSANLGEALGSLQQVASGGELSRVMLALNVVTGTDCPTLIFDEVDAGIGGQTARVVGRLLAELAQDHQVLVVTHLAQVAAFADHHFLVAKQEQDGRTTTHVQKLDATRREHELARMLSGNVSDTALAHARELLAETSTASSQQAGVPAAEANLNAASPNATSPNATSSKARSSAPKKRREKVRQ